MNFNETKDLLKKYDQEQLLEFYDELEENARENLIAQIEKIDFSLLKLLEKEDKSVVKGKITPLPGAVKTGDIEKNREEYYAIGKDAIEHTKVAAVLLAGGQGTRLGSDKPKGMYNIGLTKDVYIFEMIIRNLLDVVKDTGCMIPLFIMTSEKNNSDTIEFLEEKNYFGYDKEYVRFFVQDMAPSCNYDGKIYLEEKGKVSMSPNGNGGWFTSFINSDCIKRADELGVEWLNVFAVDNVCQRIADPCFIGATIKAGVPVGAKVVAKNAPDERVGVLCLEDGRPSIVEYYELTEELMTAKDENGDPAYNYGVILNYLFRIKELRDIVNENLPVHVVEKKIPYIDKMGNKIKPEQTNGYKFETLILDMIHMLDGCLPYEVVRNKEFAPIKNKTGVDSVESARKILAENGVEL